MKHLHEGLFNTLHAKDDFCRLCFNSVDEGAISIQDEVATNLKLSEMTEELGSILSLVIGTEVTETFSPFDKICDQCVKLGLTCYTFIKSCQQNSRDFSKAIECINTCLENLEQIENFKSLFISINLNESYCSTFYDNKKCKTKSAVLKQHKKHNRRLMIETGDSVNNKPDKNFLNCQHNINELSEIESSDTKSLPLPLLENDKYSLLKMEDGSKRYYCKFCNKVCYRVYNITRHYQNVHEKTPKHIRHNEPEHNSWVCHNCGKVLKNRGALRQHEQIHFEGIQCPKCKKLYKNNHSFSHHTCVPQLGERPILAKNFVCDQCGKKLGRKKTLLLHIKFEHGNGIPHICSYCNKKFYAASQLKKHLVRHTNEKDFKCETCGGWFVTKESLLYHVRTHTGEKPYKCRFCEKLFLSTSRRADHVRIHHMAPSLPCSICNKLFKTHSQVKKHKLLHLDPKSSLYIGNACSNRLI